MKQVTRNIDLEDARDLLERVPRAAIAFAGEHGPWAQPVAAVWRQDRPLVGIPEGVEDRPGPDQEVVLLIDEGLYFFDLRAVYIRGRARPAEAPEGAPSDHIWFEVHPTKTVAWDYGTLHEVEDEG